MGTSSPEWEKTACILCSVNCGLEVQTGGEDGRRIIKIRGDDAHPVSWGYLSLRASPQDAQVLNVRNGDTVRVRTRRASLQAQVEVTAIMQPGHISLPNGQGLDCRGATGRIIRMGVPPNELTDRARRDFPVGTPWHKYVPAQLERIQPEQAA